MSASHILYVRDRYFGIERILYQTKDLLPLLSIIDHCPIPLDPIAALISLEVVVAICRVEDLDMAP